MMREEVEANPRRDVCDIIALVPGGAGYDKRLELAIERAMTLEWWRGYFTAVDLALNLESALKEMHGDEAA